MKLLEVKRFQITVRDLPQIHIGNILNSLQINLPFKYFKVNLKYATFFATEYS